MLRAVGVVLLFVSLSAGAKCIRETYQLEGRLTDASGHAVPNATVTITWGGTTKWNSGTESSQSNAEGSFAVTVLFDTLSGEGLRGDICEGRLTSAFVDVAVPGYRPLRREVQFSGRRGNITLKLERT